MRKVSAGHQRDDSLFVHSPNHMGTLLFVSPPLFLTTARARATHGYIIPHLSAPLFLSRSRSQPRTGQRGPLSTPIRSRMHRGAARPTRRTLTQTPSRPRARRGGPSSACRGDPRTPGWPSCSQPGACEAWSVQDLKDKGLLPTIPALPTSYTNAARILRDLQGAPCAALLAGRASLVYRGLPPRPWAC